MTTLAALLVPLLAASPAFSSTGPWITGLGSEGGDWPQYSGASGDRTSAERITAPDWSSRPPRVVWRAATSLGFSSFCVAGPRVYTLVARELGGESREVCVALDRESGKEVWATPVGSGGAPDYDGGGDAGAGDNKGGDGPRSTPSHDMDRVYVLDAALVLSCLDDRTGALAWRLDLVEEHGARNIRWQNAASPLVEGDHVFVVGGGAGEALLAFDKRTGELAWAHGDERMTHATPTAATLCGRRQVLFLVQSGIIAVEPATGEELWRAEYPYSVSTAASPVVYDDVVYVSAGYGVGAGAFVVEEEGGTLVAEPLWRQRNRLINHWSTPVVHDGYLYGMFSFKEYGDGPLKCVDLATGETMWSEEGFGPGNCIVVGEHVVALSDAGEVVVVDATPDAYRERARADLLTGKCWSMPAFADGRLFVRSTDMGVCVELPPPSRGSE